MIDPFEPYYPPASAKLTVPCPCQGQQVDCKTCGGFGSVEVIHETRPSWDRVFMDFAASLAQRSTCSRARVGSVVVTADNHRILSMGYNGSYTGGPNRCDSDEPGACGCLHAEDNAMIKLNYNEPSSKKLYTTTSPCIICAKRIINAKIEEVIYLKEYRKTEGVELLQNAGVRVRKYEQPSLP